MNSQNESQSLKRQFLEEKAKEWGFCQDRQIAFLEGFDPSNWPKPDEELAKNIKWTKDLIAQSKSIEQKDDQPNSNPRTQKQKKRGTYVPYADRPQKLRDELTNIYPILMALEIEGFPQLDLHKGGYKEGESPREKTYKWLWEDDYPKWLSKRQIDWHDICLKMLNNQRALTSNDLLGDRKDTQFEHDKMFVHLALVQLTKPDERSAEVSPEAGARLYEPQYKQEQRFERDDFFTQILEGGKGKINRKRIALIGEPGAGKTTLLQDIAFRLMGETDSPRQQETKDVVIWISLAELQGRSLEDYLRQTWLKDALAVVDVTLEMEKALAELFNSGRVWLLLDGVDEMASGDLRQALVGRMRGWVASAQVVLTCRLNIRQANPKFLVEFVTYRLLDFDYPQQVHRFINNWFGTSDAAKGEQLKTELDAAEQVRLQNLVQNPLRLALLCSIWQKWEGKLPQTKAALYQMFVEQLYEWKKDFFDIPPQTKDELNSAFERLAKLDIGRDGSRFRLLESFIRKVLGNPKDETSLFYKALELGWLNKVGIAPESSTRETVYAFFHPTFEEYFAAKGIENWNFFLKHIPDNPNRSDASYRIFEPKWEEVILLWLGREDVKKEHKEEFIQALVEFDGGCGNFYARRAYFLAAKGIAEFKGCSRADEIVEQMVKWCLERDFRIQEELWEVFAVFQKTERTKAINALTRIIDQSQSEYIRLQAAWSLVRIDKGNFTAIDALVALIENSQDKFIPWQAADILGQNAKDNTTAINALVEALVDLMQNSPKSENISWVGRSLQIIAKGNLEVVNALELLIDRSQSEDIAFEVASILGEIDEGNRKAICTLLKLIRESQHGYIRQNAANHLGPIAKGNSKAIEDLVELVDDNSQPEDIRRLAANILGQIAKGDSTAINTLVELTQNSQNEEIVLQAVIRSLGEIGSDNSITIKALTQRIQHSQNEEIVLQAAISLGKINSGNSIAINAILELTQNSHNISILRKAAWSFSFEKIDLGTNPKVITKVINALVKLIQTSQDKFVIQLAGWSLREIDSGNPEVIKALTHRIQNSQNEEIVLQAAESLREIDSSNPKIIEALESLVQTSQSEKIRIDAAQNLRKIEPHNSIALDTLKSSAQNYSSNDSRRHGVVRSLSILGRDEMQEVVTELKDHISNRPSQNDFREYRHLYEIIWNCAETLSYPEFYQAWHPSPHTPDSQSLNLADLPERLQAALDSDEDLRGKVQLIYIDGSKFIEPDNPADYIYARIVRHGCSERDNGTPETMKELQVYWEMLPIKSDKRVVLVFYEDPTAPPQGFSETFLNPLSKFDKAICVISSQPNIPPQLKSFFPNQPNLVADVVEWVRNIVLENS